MPVPSVTCIAPAAAGPPPSRFARWCARRDLAKDWSQLVSSSSVLLSAAGFALSYVVPDFAPMLSLGASSIAVLVILLVYPWLVFNRPARIAAPGEIAAIMAQLPVQTAALAGSLGQERLDMSERGQLLTIGDIVSLAKDAERRIAGELPTTVTAATKQRAQLRAFRAPRTKPH